MDWNNSDDVKKWYKEYHLKNKEKHNKLCKENYYKNKEKHKERTTIARLKRLYGLTPDDYDKMYSLQSGCCVICGKHQSELNHTLNIDHNHITNRVRGLICQPCNAAIGMLKVDEKGIELLLSAAKYIEDYDKV